MSTVHVMVHKYTEHVVVSTVCTEHVVVSTVCTVHVVVSTVCTVHVVVSTVCTVYVVVRIKEYVLLFIVCVALSHRVQ